MKDLRVVPVNPNLADQIDEYAKLLRETFQNRRSDLNLTESKVVSHHASRV